MNNPTDFPTSKQESFRPQIAHDTGASESHEKHKKKRSKLIRIGDPVSTQSNSFLKPKSGKKPEPNTPKITPPCSECGKQFWSWKALFGHMRCHPERHWRGINPPKNCRRPISQENPEQCPGEILTEEDHEVARCLLMLANGSSAMDTPSITMDLDVLLSGNSTAEPSWAPDADGAGPSNLNFRFECSSCKKVFGSRQALGGHRASHKNIKGCFAIARNDSEDEGRYVINDDDRGGGARVPEDKMDMVLGHKCSICSRVFSSGQALGGHKRCHWEKGEEPSSIGLNPREGCLLDLNLPAPIETVGGSSSSSSSSSSNLALDLRLGI